MLAYASQWMFSNLLQSSELPHCTWYTVTGNIKIADTVIQLETFPSNVSIVNIWNFDSAS